MTATPYSSRRRLSASRFSALALALACGAALLGVGGTADASTPPAITVHSGQHEQTTESLVTAFEEKTGIKVNVRYDDEDTFVDRIETEGSHSPASVFYTENTPPLEPGAIPTRITKPSPMR